MTYTLTVTSLFTRDKWSQEPFVRYTEDDLKNNISLDFSYNLNGEKKPWNVEVCDSQLRCPSLPIMTLGGI